MGNSSSTHEPLERGFTRGQFGDVKNSKSASFRQSKRSPKKMDRLRKSFRDSFRRRKDRVPEASKPHQWQSDEQAVRSATCTFAVKYLGCVEVFESRGMQVCEEALKVLRNSRRRAIRATLHISGDGLRVVEEDTKGLIVDQTIEKVSFCAPDRNHERGFSYICRDGTTRRWMCHGFLAIKDSGERLSHAVGCAFAVCLERKQRRDKECGVTMTFDLKNSTFTRTGSFRQHTMTERLANNTDGVHMLSNTNEHHAVNVVAPQPKPFNPFAIERPHATPSMLERQGSFRGFVQIGAQSPFKRQMSLRINDLPSNAERQRAFLEPLSPLSRSSVSPIPEVSPQPQPVDTVSALCQELSQGLSLLTKNDTDDFNFNNESSINQNMASSAACYLNTSTTTTSPTEMTSTQLSVFTTSAMSNPPPPLPSSQPPPVAPRTATPLNLSSASTTSVTSTTAVSTSLTTSPQKIVPIEPVSPLPKPEQWLGQIVKQTSPTPRRTPSLHQRAKSLTTNPTDPFDAEWASDITGPEIHSTNPFISPPKPPVHTFQVHL